MAKSIVKKTEVKGKKNPDEISGIDGSSVGTSTIEHAEPKKINLSEPVIQNAISQGQALIKEGKSKADAARLIYDLLQSEGKDVIVATFIAGANLTEKGALTYWYNCKRKKEKQSSKD